MKILNSKGEPILLNAREARISELNQRMINALGYEITVTTLTTIMKKITEQKFFQIAPADYMPVVVGEGAWSSQLQTYLSYDLADDFSTGVIDTGSGTRLASASAGVQSLSVKVINWAKANSYNLFDLELAEKSGSWDLVVAKEKSRLKNWQLGIQKVAFLGLSGDSNVLGLYTQAGITTNTTLIPQSISTMSTVDFKNFCAKVLDAYRSNCQRTAMPTHFVLPESDYIGLAAPTNADFPLKSTLQVLEETFQVMTQNKQFKILPCAYGESTRNGTANQIYALYNYEEESLRMNIPVDYTNSLANSVDNFNFNNVGYGQFTGVLAYRPSELLYFTYPA